MITALDTESTTYNVGHPFDSRNKLVCWSWATDEEGSAAHQWPSYDLLNERLDKSTLLVGFNFKHDYHWLRLNGVDLSKHHIWDVQLAEFILSNQTHRFPSLNETCLRYNIGQKFDVVKSQYWDKGIQTDEIPWDILEEYAAYDAFATLQCYHAQRKEMTPHQIKLCQLMCMDLHVLEEMEFNGLTFDEQLCLTRANEIDAKIKTITERLKATYPKVPINFASNDHLSAFLYGGVVKEYAKEHIGFFKTGEKAGQPKYKNVVIEHQLPRLYTPIKGSELIKEGFFATDEGTLKKLKGKKETVNLILELAKLEKLNGTYYRGLPQLREKMHWPPGVLHGQFNQCIASTGRLSSSKPNLQNFAGDLQDIFTSRYA